MEDTWPARFARIVAGEVRRYRLRRNMSTQQLADVCADLGLPIQRSVLANFEHGRRETVTVAELLVLARALQVPPIALVFPLGHEERVEALPGTTMSTWDAVAWFTGEKARADESGEWVTMDGLAVELFRRHDRYVREAASAKGRDDDRALRLASSALWEVRDAMPRAGLTPPPLPSWLQHVDEGDRP